MSDKQIPIEQVLEILGETSRRITAMTAGVPTEQLRTRPAPDVWSANEVLAHLRACADQWGGCINAMLAEDNPTLRAINPRSWIKQTDYLDLPFDASFRAFVAQRDELLVLLTSISADAWTRSATMTGAGAPIRRTVRGFAERLARHERPHVNQIETIVTAVRG